VVVGFVVEVKNVLQVVDEVGVLFRGNLPVVREMQFQGG
jgi:hypothetical protein